MRLDRRGGHGDLTVRGAWIVVGVDGSPGVQQPAAYSTAAFKGARSQCSAPVTHARLRLGGEPMEAWLTSACTLRASKLTGARELLDHDLATLAD